MNLYDKYKKVDKVKQNISNMLKVGVMTEGQVMEELGLVRTYANWILNKMTKEGYLLKVMAPDPSGVKRLVAHYKSSDVEFVARTDAEIKEFFSRRNAVMAETKASNKPLKGGKIYNLLDRKRDWDNPKPKRKTVVAIGSSFSLY